MQPLGKELLHIVVVAGRLDKNLRVAGPAEAFVPLGAVGGNVEEIALLTPENIGDQLIEHRIGGFDFPGLSNVGINGDRGKLRDIGRAGKCRQPDIPKAEEGQLRVPSLKALPAGVMNLGLRRAIVGVIEVAVRVQHLAVLDADDISFVGVNG